MLLLVLQPLFYALAFIFLRIRNVTLRKSDNIKKTDHFQSFYEIVAGRRRRPEEGDALSVFSGGSFSQFDRGRRLLQCDCHFLQSNAYRCS